MAARDDDGEVAVPPTLQALLAARLDQLDMPERRVLERGAVEGEVFHRGAVAGARSDEEQLPPRLAALVRKELDPPRQAAARRRRRLPLPPPADPRRRLRRAAEGDPGRAARALRRLARGARRRPGRAGRDPRLPPRAGGSLPGRARAARPGAGRAGRRASRRRRPAGALARRRRAAAALLERALELTRPLRLDVHLELDLAEASAAPIRERPRRSPSRPPSGRAAAGDETGEALARVVAAARRSQFAARSRVDELEALARAALPLLEQAGDHAGLVHVWYALGSASRTPRPLRGLGAGSRAGAPPRAGSPASRRETLLRLGLALATGRGRRTRRCDVRRLDDGRCHASRCPCLAAGRARPAREARPLRRGMAHRARASERERELRRARDTRLAEIATLAGDHERGRAICARSATCSRSAASAATSRHTRRSSAVAVRARPLRRGRAAGAARPRARRRAATSGAQALWRQVQARVSRTAANTPRRSGSRARRSRSSSRPTALNYQGDALCDLAEVLAAAGRTDEAAAALEQALERYERKKNLAMVAQVRPRLEELRAGVTCAP